jgi:hypothetical protein
MGTKEVMDTIEGNLDLLIGLKPIVSRMVSEEDDKFNINEKLALVSMSQFIDRIIEEGSDFDVSSTKVSDFIIALPFIKAFSLDEEELPIHMIDKDDFLSHLILWRLENGN